MSVNDYSDPHCAITVAWGYANILNYRNGLTVCSHGMRISATPFWNYSLVLTARFGNDEKGPAARHRYHRMYIVFTHKAIEQTIRISHRHLVEVNMFR